MHQCAIPAELVIHSNMTGKQQQQQQQQQQK